MKAIVPSILWGLRSALLAASKVALSGPWPFMQLWSEAPPGAGHFLPTRCPRSTGRSRETPGQLLATLIVKLLRKSRRGLWALGHPEDIGGGVAALAGARRQHVRPARRLCRQRVWARTRRAALALDLLHRATRRDELAGRPLQVTALVTDDTPEERLTYAWSFGNGRSGSGPVPSHTHTPAGAFTVTLTVRDEYGLTGTTTGTVTIAEPAGNQPPVPVINPPSCANLVCNISGVGSADPNTGDTFTYLWNFGDGPATSTSSAMSHTFPAAGTYTLTLTVTDGWGDAATTTRPVTVTAPPPAP